MKSQLKAAQDNLEAKIAAKYPTLNEDAIKRLVVDDKWVATLATAAQGELDRVSQSLAGRVRQLAERYGSPLPKLEEDLAKLSTKVDAHLRKIGATCN